MRREGYSSCLVCVCVCVSVCLYVCLSEHTILAVRAIRSITKDAIVLSVRFAAILKRRFSLNCLIRKLEHFPLTSAGAAIFIDTYSACNVSYTLRYMFARIYISTVYIIRMSFIIVAVVVPRVCVCACS